MRVKESGYELLLNPFLNKGCAFTSKERHEFSLVGKLPVVVETIEEQCHRAYQQVLEKSSALEKNLLLNELYATNRTLFFKLIDLHLNELLPIIYTPTIGEAVMKFSRNFMRPQGLIISYPEIDLIDSIFADIDSENIDIAIVTDGEGVLGIGDQGIGGLNIAIGKLMVYTACAGIDPRRAIPIQLDVGTNNQELLADPMYMGWRNERIAGAEYDRFIERFVASFKKRFKKTFLHWEDFGKDNARRVLDKFRKIHPSFNDDIQGTGAISLAAVLTGIKKSGIPVEKHRFCIFGAGTAGTGIADQICQALAKIGNLDLEEIRKRFYLIDRHGLIIEGQSRTLDFQRPYAKTNADYAGWNCSISGECSLIDTVKNAGITVLIGCSTATGAFNSEVLKQMAKNCEHPLILPLSNPTSKAEATPDEIFAATDGKALIATGSPFSQVEFAGKRHRISQCNNALIYPGIALGMIISEANELTDNMLFAASMALSENCNPDPDNSELLPDLNRVKQISIQIAKAVAIQAAEDNVTPDLSEEDFSQRIADKIWQPQYYDYEKA
jgi:malate dehydrogenase (oxaloacetate-decarboxylating)